MRIQHNIMAMNSYRNFSNNTKSLGKNLEKLSSGYRINRAGDDAAGLAISEKMRAQVTGLKTAQKNAKDGISLVQTGEGALTEVHSMLNRMLELADQSANGTFDDVTDRANLQKEVVQLRDEINRIADSTNFNGIKLLDGSLDDAVAGTGTGNGQKSALVDGAIFTNEKAVADSFTATTAVGAVTTAAVDMAITIDYMDEHGASKQMVVNIAGVTAAAATATGTSIIAKLNADSKFSALFTASDKSSADGKIILTAKTPGSSAPRATGFSIAKSGGTGTFADVASGGDNDAVVGKDAFGKIDLTGIEAGKSVTIGNKTYQFVTTATDKVEDGNVAVLAGGDSTDAATNLLAALKANGVTTASQLGTADEIILIGDLKQISVEQKGIHISSESMGVNINNTAATAGKFTQAIGDGSAAAAGASGTKTFTLNYLDKNGKEQQAQVDYKCTATAATNREAILTALNQNDSLKELFDMKAAGVGVGIEFTAKGKGSEGAVAMSSKTSDTTPTAIGGMTTQRGQDAGKSLNFVNDDIKNGDTFTVGNKTYEFVSDLNKKPVGAGNIGVVKGSTDAETLKAVAALLKADGIDLTSDGSKIFFEDKAEVPSNGLTLQIGDTSESFNKITVSVGDMHAKALGIGDIDIGKQPGGSDAVQLIKDAINSVSSTRGDLGATQNRLDHTINNLSVMAENIQDAEANIRDVDVAEEMMQYTKNNILVQSAQAMLAQANQVPQGVLQLLQ